MDCRTGRALDPLAPAREWLSDQVGATLREKLGDPGPAPTAEVCTFLEALLKVEYPGRRVAVTPAPLMEGTPAAESPVGVLDVTLGPTSQESPWVSFRVSVQEAVARQDWVAVGAQVLSVSRREFALWPLRRRGDEPAASIAETTRTLLSEWFDAGVAEKARYMVIATDTFNWEDYPVFVREDGKKTVHEVAHELEHAPMSRVMEVYDLEGDKVAQLPAGRAWAIPRPPPGPSRQTLSEVLRALVSKDR